YCIFTLWISIIISIKLGNSAFGSLLGGLHRTFGLTVGSWEVVVGLTMLLGNALAEKKKPEFYAILTSLITGIGIDSWLFLLGNWVIPVTWLGQSVCLGLGIIFTGMGVASYLQSNFAPNPMDRS